MYAVLGDDDDVIVRCEFADIVVVHNDEENSYTTLWKRQSDMQYQIMWRGNFEGALKEFSSIVGDIVTERHRGAEALGA